MNAPDKSKKEQVRAWLTRRVAERAPPPSLKAIREQLDWIEGKPDSDSPRRHQSSTKSL